MKQTDPSHLLRNAVRSGDWTVTVNWEATDPTAALPSGKRQLWMEAGSD